MAQQNYSRNVPFNTYTLEQLIADNINDWTWKGRTLVGYISAGSETIIPLGDQLTIDTPTAELSGAWELNKLDLSVHIINAADDSYVELSGKIRQINSTLLNTEYYSNCYPLTDQSAIYEIKNQAKNGDICKFWFNTSLCCTIHPGTNRTISAVWYDDKSKLIDQTISPTDHGEVSSFMIGSNYTSYQNPGICVNEVISVYLAEGGIMHYYSNKNTVNPYHPTLDD